MLRVNPDVAAGTHEKISTGLRANKFDAIVSSMSITDERKKAVAFTDKYYQTPTAVIAKAGSIDGSIASVKGKRVGVLKASIQEGYAKGVFAPAGATVVSYDSTQQAYLDLKSGRVDAVIVDKFEGKGGFLDTPDGKGYAFVGPDLTDARYFGTGARTCRTRSGSAPARASRCARRTPTCSSASTLR